MSLFPTDDKQRKCIPVFKYFTRYFPKAQREITKVCVANNVRYNPDRDPADINWARGKSPDQLGSALHHMMESVVDGKVFEDIDPEIAAKVGFSKVYVLAEAAWRITAALELAIDEEESKVPFTPLISDVVLTAKEVRELLHPQEQPLPTADIQGHCACKKYTFIESTKWQLPEYVSPDGVSHQVGICTPGGTRCPRCKSLSHIEASNYPENGNIYCNACRRFFCV